MKKSLLFLALTAQINVLAQSTEPKSAPVLSSQEVTIEVTPSKASEKKPEAVVVEASNEVKKEEPKKALVPTPVSHSELLELGIDASLTSTSFNSIQLSGELPEACAAKLRFGKTEYIQTGNESLDSSVSTAEDLGKLVTAVRVPVLYLSEGENDSLRDCVLNSAEDAKKVSLSGNSKFSKRLSVKPSMMMAQVAGGPILKTSDLAETEGLMTNLSCSNCNNTVDKALKNISAAKSNALLAGLVKGLYDSAIISAAEQLEKVKTLSELSKAQEQLKKLLAMASDDEQKEKLKALFLAVIQKNEAMVRESEATYIGANRHLEFGIKARQDFAANFADSEEGEKLSEEAKALAEKESPARLFWLKEVDPNHPEMKNYLKKADQLEGSLRKDVQSACYYGLNIKCNAARQKLADFQRSHAPLRQSFMQAELKDQTELYGAPISTGPQFTPNAPANDFWSNSQAQGSVNFAGNAGVNNNGYVYSPWAQTQQNFGMPMPYMQNGLSINAGLYGR